MTPGQCKRKGSAGERELCRILTDAGFPAERNDQRLVGGLANPDISAEGLQSFHIEVKRVERLNIHSAMNQAIRDADGEKTPVVMHRRNGEPWLATLTLKAFLAIVRNHKVVVEVKR